MTRLITCVACPRGCAITAGHDDDGKFFCEGNACPRGSKYAETELTDPKRVVTSTVRVEGGADPVVPIKTDAPVPKKLIFDVMRELDPVRVKAPVSIGQVIVADILGTGSNIVATNNVKAV